MAEAHAVLSDPHRKERYDLGEDEDGMNGGGSGGFGGGGFPGGMNPSDIEEIFAQFAGARFGGGARRGAPHGHSHGFPF